MGYWKLSLASSRFYFHPYEFCGIEEIGVNEVISKILFSDGGDENGCTHVKRELLKINRLRHQKPR